MPINSHTDLSAVAVAAVVAADVGCGVAAAAGWMVDQVPALLPRSSQFRVLGRQNRN